MIDANRYTDPRNVTRETLEDALVVLGEMAVIVSQMPEPIVLALVAKAAMSVQRPELRYASASAGLAFAEAVQRMAGACKTEIDEAFDKVAKT